MCGSDLLEIHREEITRLRDTKLGELAELKDRTFGALQDWHTIGGTKARIERLQGEVSALNAVLQLMAPADPQKGAA